MNNFLLQHSRLNKWSMVQTPIESENFLFLNWNRFKEFQCSGASIFFVSLKKYICQPSRDFYKEKIHICPSQNINICSTFIRWIGQSTQIPFKTNVKLRSLPFMKAWTCIFHQVTGFERAVQPLLKTNRGALKNSIKTSSNAFIPVIKTIWLAAIFFKGIHDFTAQVPL